MRFNLSFFYITGLLMISYNLSSRSFEIGHTTVSFVDSSRDNRKIRTEIYYPSDTTGKNAAFTQNHQGKFPVLCFGHGYQMSWNSYKYIRDYLVPHGFIIVFPKSERELFPSHIDFAIDIAFILDELLECAGDPSSIFYNRVDTMNCAMGHSMGGGSAILAAQFSSSVRSLAVLAPLDTRPSSISAASELVIPSMIITGKNDCITPPAMHQVPLYLNLKSSSKIIITIKGGSHCQMADRNIKCRLAESTCRPGPEITDKAQQQIVLKYLLPWLNFHLKGDPASGERFDALLASDPSVEFERN